VPQPDGGLRLHTQGQGVHDDRRQVAAALDLDLDRVHVVLEPNGGGFGGKEDLSCQAHAALLAMRTKRPVRLELTRAQSILLSPKRHPITMDYTVACDDRGRLTAVRARIVGDTGGHLSVGTKVLERAAGHSCGPYRVPAVDVEAVTVYTNNPPSGAFRGFGVNQVAFAMEGLLDRLAEAVGIDGYDIRERNVLDEGDRFATGQRMDAGVGIRRTLEAVRDVYKGAPRAGIACGIKNTGMGNGMPDVGRTLIEVDRPDHLTVYTGFTEMGQGLLTVLQQVVCHETGLAPSIVDVVVSTDRPVECGMTTASRATMLASEATRRAAVSLRDALTHGSLEALVGRGFPGEFVCDFTSAPGEGGDDAVTHVAFGYATQVVLLDEAGRVDRVVAAHDVGRVMNRTGCTGQIEGAIVMGLGFALTEDLPCEGGVPVTTRIGDLGLLRSADVPRIDVKLLEVPEPHTEYGVKGVGEIGLVPTAPAVAAALYAFDGIRRTRLPMRGSAAARAILPRKRHEPDHP
jgi:xanthine dehydrogenase molybdenum-binding subunit